MSKKKIRVSYVVRSAMCSTVKSSTSSINVWPASPHFFREADGDFAHRGSVNAIASTRDESAIITAGRDSTIRLWKNRSQAVCVLSRSTE